MNYEDKKAIVVFCILEAVKFVVNNDNPKLNTQNEFFHHRVTADEVDLILRQLQASKKIKIISFPASSSYITIDNPRLLYEYQLKVLDLQYLKDLLPKKPVMKQLNELTEEITGYTAEERVRINAVERAVKEKELAPNIREFFIEYKDDKVIMLNGKIDIGRPHFGNDNQIVFEFLYNHPNQVFTEKELLEKTNAKVIGKLTKIVESLGFRRGLGKAFFEINTTSIKFKNHIKL